MNQQGNREPSIHISQSHFKKILGEELETLGIKVAKLDNLVNAIVSKAYKYALTSRKILVSNKKHTKTAKRLVASTLEDARLFSQTLLLVRRKNFHRGVTPIREDSREWLTLKEITQAACNFCSDFELDKRKGFAIYLEIALKKVKGFYLQKLLSLHETICNEYSAKLRIIKDPTPSKTKLACTQYTSIIASKTGDAPNYEDMPGLYQYFIDIVNQSHKVGISTDIYIKAQFDAFNWKQSVPELAQMVGEKANERLYKYLYANNIEVRKNTPKINFNQIRNADRGSK